MMHGPINITFLLGYKIVNTVWVKKISTWPEIYKKHIITLCGQKVELLNVRLGGTYSNH